MTLVFDLKKMFYFENVVASFQAKNNLILWNDGFLVHLYLLDPSGVVITLAFLVWVSIPPWCSSRW